MRLPRKTLLILVAVLAGLTALTAAYAAWTVHRVEASLPSVESLREPNLGAPLKVYSADGKIIGEFGAERRTPIAYAQLPQTLIDAFLAAEDDRFFEHSGVDFAGLLRAAIMLAATGEKRQGGSTITMQLARNVFLTPERSYERKIREILLAQKMERELDKKQILELYLNRIFLGSRAYGVAAAANIYFGKTVKELSLSETAVLAGLPKAPSRDNPLVNPKRAKDRRDYVLRRLRDLGKIDKAAYEQALAEPVEAREHPLAVEVQAHYVAEMMRAHMVEKYGENAYSAGYKVYTTIDSARQTAADEALRRAVLDYEERHGFPGPEATLDAAALAGLQQNPPSAALVAALKARPPLQGLLVAAVLDNGPEGLRIYTREQGVQTVGAKAMAWAGKKATTLVRGDLVRVRQQGGELRLSQVPAVQGALISLDPRDGSVQALVGGFDFFAGKYNRVTQARRQAGSGFKPLLYTAALSRGYTPASIFLDAPIVFDDPGLEKEWRPSNYDNDYNGPMRLREALVQSRNLVSIRVLQAVGLSYMMSYAQNFGLDRGRLPRDLTMALGSAALTPMEIARSYATIANGGFLIEPYLIKRIEDAHGQSLYTARPVKACPECPSEITAGDTAGQLAPRTLDPRSVYLINSMLHDVAIRGTAAASRAMGHVDVGGKTGTSNDETDAWFNGISPTVIATTWMGYDQPQPLGRGEVGGRAALPMWIDYMKVALKGVPDQPLPRPDGLVDIRINAANGKLATDSTAKVVSEIVQEERVPAADDGQGEAGEAGAAAQELY